MIATEIDHVIGARLREARTSAALTQPQLAAHLSITPQQLSKLERGRNAVRASQLYHASIATGVHPSFFFEGLPGVRRAAP